MWNPFRTQECRFTTRLRVEDCRARLRALLRTGSDVQALLVPSAASDPRPLSGEVSTHAFVLRKHVPYNNPMQTEARGALCPLPHGTLVHVRLGLSVEALVGILVFLPLAAAVGFVGLFGLAHQARAAGSADWWWVLACVPLVLVWHLGGSVFRYLARGDRAFLLRVLCDALEAEAAPLPPREPRRGPAGAVR